MSSFQKVFETCIVRAQRDLVFSKPWQLWCSLSAPFPGHVPVVQSPEPGAIAGTVELASTHALKEREGGRERGSGRGRGGREGERGGVGERGSGEGEREWGGREGGGREREGEWER